MVPKKVLLNIRVVAGPRRRWQTLRAEIRALEAERGEFWKPAAGLVKLAEAGGRFTKA